jgi:hypothetical protein
MTNNTCGIETCAKPRQSRNLCNTHYEAWRVGRSTNTELIAIAGPRPEKNCEVDGCELRLYQRRLCRTHYERVRRYGKTENPTFSEKFWGKVIDVGSEGCWEWIGSIVAFGYGSSWNPRLERSQPAHRVAWELTHGPIPDGIEVRHRCDNPPCVNPDHLELGTHAENMADMYQRNRAALGERLPQSKLTEPEVRAVRRIHATGGFTNAQIAEWFDVSATAIWYVVNGKTWKHLLPVLEQAAAA